MKIPPAPILPRKRLSEVARILSETENAEQFTIYSRKMSACFNNLDLIPESEIDDALSSLFIIIHSKNRGRLYASPLFATLAKMSVDFHKEIPDKLRRTLVDMMVKSSQESHMRRHLMKQETIHGLIEVSFSSCMESNEQHDIEQRGN